MIGSGRVDPALREAEQGEPAARAGRRAPRPCANASSAPCEVAEPAADVADLGVGGGAVRHVDAVELVARLARLALGVGPARRAAAAARRGAPGRCPGKMANGWSLRPAQRGLGPLGGAAEVAELLAGADQAAVHLAGRVRPEAALDREEHRLVEVAQPVGRAARGR